MTDRQKEVLLWGQRLTSQMYSAIYRWDADTHAVLQALRDLGYFTSFDGGFVVTDAGRAAAAGLS